MEVLRSKNAVGVKCEEEANREDEDEDEEEEEVGVLLLIQTKCILYTIYEYVKNIFSIESK
jgi:hypothetical protein